MGTGEGIVKLTILNVRVSKFDSVQGYTENNKLYIFYSIQPTKMSNRMMILLFLL